MYVIQTDGVFAGYADSIVPIRLHGNGCYVPCEESQADGFCAKMAVTQTDDDGNESQALVDTVYHIDGRKLKGSEPAGTYKLYDAAVPLTEAERALAELEAAYDAE